ncbi:helix-turn-helix domain-containing protein [Chamaesiphon minutus]|uniref:Transcriptional regulator containing an amidase domain and an AraC-type DNA-binding HTH domain n=1 Tax=Chamaesiphon minutus (strain ATCC 27169 / PCC 6605) TaxID=1173020 RepID=K9UDR3_CHAP6|nr:AraC family transcriptional regulator [Chamaesiphon minutus]AFY92768.1 transcriptional regulator containing an amidase domain and an AraC-type DNA-binding HTH domain [Chamaesiphon minutus PCC 6605]
MTQKSLVIDGKKEGASSVILSDNVILSSSQNGWNDIDFEYHYQQAAFIPEHQNTELVIAIGHSPMLIRRWLAGEFREEHTQVGEIQVNPAYSPQSCSWESPISFSLLLLKSTEIANATFDYADPDLVEVLPHFSQADPLIYGIAQSLKMQLDRNYTASKIYLESIRSTAIFHILQNYSNQKTTDLNALGGLTTQDFKKVIDYIHSNFNKDFGLAELSNLVGLSSRYFSELFKTSTGYSPFDYLLKFRLAQASKLLLTTKLPIFDVAQQTGFSSSNNFCRAFRKHYTISPNKYRQDNTRK